MEGTVRVVEWLERNNWPRDERYNSNFNDRDIVEEYERVWFDEWPVCNESAYAQIGGWHTPGPDDDWYDHIQSQLLIQTIKDSEPWVEAWRLSTNEYRVIQRIT